MSKSARELVVFSIMRPHVTLDPRLLDAQILGGQSAHQSLSCVTMLFTRLT